MSESIALSLLEKDTNTTIALNDCQLEAINEWIESECGPEFASGKYGRLHRCPPLQSARFGTARPCIKVFGYSSLPSARKFFDEEVQTLRELTTESWSDCKICPTLYCSWVHESETKGICGFIIMEYIEGPSVMEFMKQQSKISVPQSGPYLSNKDIQVLLFKLLRMHKLGITHGDCHGGNIIRVDSEPPDFIFLDFGHRACRSKKAYDFYKLFFSISSRDHASHIQHYRRMFHIFLPEDITLPPEGVRVGRTCQFTADIQTPVAISWRRELAVDNDSDASVVSCKRMRTSN